MSNKNATKSAPETTETETARAKRGSTKQARAVQWFQEAYAFAVANGNLLSDHLLEVGRTLAAEFVANKTSKPLPVRLAEANAQIDAIYELAQTDPAQFRIESAKLGDLFIEKDKVEKRIARNEREAAAKNNPPTEPAA